MKRFYILCFVVFIALGCAAVKQAGTDAKACLADPACLAQAKAEAERGREIGLTLGGISPIPLSANVVGAVSYGLVLIYALIKGGHKKREDDIVVPTP